jgi:hypothetical protein
MLLSIIDLSPNKQERADEQYEYGNRQTGEA